MVQTMQNKKCYVAADLRNVLYNGNPYSLSALARILSKSDGKDWPHRGPMYFEYRGVKLSKIIEDINAECPE